MMQLTGHYITLYAKEDGTVTKESFNDAIEEAKDIFINDICNTTLHALSDTDITFLHAMLCDKDISRIADIALRMQVSKDYAQQYRRRLLDSGVIEAARRGEVRFAVPYLREFLMKEPS